MQCSHNACCHGIHNIHNTPTLRHDSEHRSEHRAEHQSEHQSERSKPPQRESGHSHNQQLKEPAPRPNSQTTHGHHSRQDRDFKSVNVKISGKVQGVYYRKWTVETAKKMSLNGWVKNCKDGTVEAVFSGKAAAVDHMLDKCKVGPSRARVTGVDINKCEEPKMKGFDIVNNGTW